MSFPESGYGNTVLVLSVRVDVELVLDPCFSMFNANGESAKIMNSGVDARHVGG